ncbi:GNAT family acetyltransferase [Oleiphilus messinensis]|uniref:GNAT family acetyltransferase n=1 Tax=Oleiphilus messinensis TaxID=141451 RepID=A0A1Y0IBT9_9GAMM|nr:GNAT family N-acetyltransferase [Oleiphilus messinensis]ARU57988.1 GNAT family acetyltransferase [Oleiphilus messinensis]
MKTRLIGENDLEECARLYAQVFSSEPWNEDWTLEHAFNRLSHFYKSMGFLGVLLENESVVSFALGNWEPFYFGNMFYLREMCTHTRFQANGYGSRVYTALENELRANSVNSIYLTTEREIPAASFYQSNGFSYSEKMGFYAKRLNS